MTRRRRSTRRVPRSPTITEIWWFSFTDLDLPKDFQDLLTMIQIRIFGPAGLLEQDDGENWDQSTRATAGVVARRYPLNFAMGLGHGKARKHCGSGRISR